MTPARLSGPERVQAALDFLGLDRRVESLPGSTRTAQEAADAVGCSTAQIAKSLIFRGRETGRALLVVLSGADRVDLDRLAALAGEPVGRADPDFVRQATGFAIGGVPPLGHEGPVVTWLDRGLERFDRIWAAAGGPHSIFETTPAELSEASGAPWADLSSRAG